MKTRLVWVQILQRKRCVTQAYLIQYFWQDKVTKWEIFQCFQKTMWRLKTITILGCLCKDSSRWARRMRFSSAQLISLSIQTMLSHPQMEKVLSISQLPMGWEKSRLWISMRWSTSRETPTYLKRCSNSIDFPCIAKTPKIDNQSSHRNEASGKSLSRRRGRFARSLLFSNSRQRNSKMVDMVTFNEAITNAFQQALHRVGLHLISQFCAREAVLLTLKVNSQMILALMWDYQICFM